ncbi:MAG: ATP-binding protein [Syntrophomonadaceae bacterium]|nr:ATP-binding protein [Syntrophomonadaceae bacterium]
MFNSFRWKLTGTYMIIIVIILAAMGITLSWTFKDYYMDNVKSNLIYEAVLVAEMAESFKEEGEPKHFMQEVCAIAGRDTENRVTIVNEDGLVLGDSQFDPQTMDRHNNRPEIYQALQGKTGVELRLSDTAKVQMLYVAVPFTAGDIKGAVRIAQPLTQVEELYRQVSFIVLLAIFLIGLVALALSIAIAKRVTRPLQDLTAGVQDMTQGNLKLRIAYQSEDEVGILANAVNHMAQSLDNSINEMSEVNSRLEALLCNTVNGILMVDHEGRVNYANPVAFTLLSLKDNYLGRKHVEIIGNYELLGIIDKVRAELNPLRRNIVLHTLGEKVVEVNVLPLSNNKDGAAGGVLVVLNDISEITRLEEVRKDFVANVSHELKTPVATISGFAETLMNEGDLGTEHVKEFSSIIYEESQRLSRIINRLLELSRLESYQQQLNSRLIDMGAVIEYAINIVKKRSNSPELNISFTKPAEAVCIAGDEDLIVQIMLNLLDNAINYSSRGQEISVSLEESEETIKVSVADKGEGIPEKDLPRIFERFYRVDKTRSKKTGGTGLGLSIVKHLVENHGGQVGVKSQLGQGSVFYFILPK